MSNEFDETFLMWKDKNVLGKVGTPLKQLKTYYFRVYLFKMYVYSLCRKSGSSKLTVMTLLTLRKTLNNSLLLLSSLMYMIRLQRPALLPSCGLFRPFT